MNDRKSLVALTASIIMTSLLVTTIVRGPLAVRADTPGATTLAPVPLTGNWVADPMHTNVVFTIQHLGISLVRGRFDDMAGTISADSEHPEKSSVQFTIQTASIDTNVKMRDDDLRSKNYFDAATYPTITFVSTSVEKGKHGGYVAHGDLTIHGITKNIALPFTINGPIHDPFGGVRFAVLTHVVLNRQDFGVGGHDVISNGSLAIGNDVDIDISLEAVPPKPAG